MASVKVNVCLVGVEDFSDFDREKVRGAIRVMREIWAAVGLQVNVDRYKMSRAQAGGLTAPEGGAGAEKLTHKGVGPPNSVDMFVVKFFKGNAPAGQSPHAPGPCNKNAKGMTGVVVSIMSIFDDRNGTVFAHELGHYLGLSHTSCTDPAVANNLMRGGGCDAGARRFISPSQAATAKSHCFITP